MKTQEMASLQQGVSERRRLSAEHALGVEKRQPRQDVVSLTKHHPALAKPGPALLLCCKISQEGLSAHQPSEAVLHPPGRERAGDFISSPISLADCSVQSHCLGRNPARRLPDQEG